MTSQVPQDLSKLTPSILGPAEAAPKGVLVTSADLIAPVGGSIDYFEVDGRRPVDVRATLGGREISSTRVFLRPGQIGDPDLHVDDGQGPDRRP